MEFDDILRRLLDDWRTQKAIEELGLEIAERRGPSMVLPQQLLNRIIDCAHFEKIKSIEDLRRETGWPCPDDVGSTIVAMIAAQGSPQSAASLDSPVAPPTSTTTPPARSILTSNTLLLNTAGSTETGIQPSAGVPDQCVVRTCVELNIKTLS